VPDLSLRVETSQFRLGVSGAGAILLLVFLILIVVDVAALQFAPRLAPGVSDAEIDLLKSAAARFISPCFVFLVTWCSLKLKFKGASSRELFREFGLIPVSRTGLAASFCGGVAYHSILEYVLIPLFPARGGLTPHPTSALFESSIGIIVFVVIGGVILAPIAEEFLFRGVLYKALEQHWNRIASVIVVSVVFSLIHPGAISSGYWLTHVSLFVFPILLALSRVATGSLSNPIMLHAGYNLSEYAGYLYR
jgi:membrane protease YdiL (CAAX protease family)